MLRVLFNGKKIYVPCCVGQTVEHALSIMYTRLELERDIVGIRKKESQAMDDKEECQRQIKAIEEQNLVTRPEDDYKKISQLNINIGNCLEIISNCGRQVESKEAKYEAIDENTAITKLKLFPEDIFEVYFEDDYEEVCLQTLITKDMMRKVILVFEKFTRPCVEKMIYANMDNAKPPFCIQSPSEIVRSKSKLPFYHEEVEPFYHWVAVELQDSFNNPDNEGIFKKFIDKISDHKVDLAVERFLAIRDYQSGANEFKCASLFYNALNQLIFDDQDEITVNAACLPQYPVEGTRRTDLSIWCLSGHLPIKDILHSDFKPIRLDQAIKETLCYAVCANKSNENHQYSWSFGLPCTSKEMRLVLYLPGNNSMLTIKVASVEVKNDLKFKNFLKILYALTHWRVVDIMQKKLDPDEVVPDEVVNAPCGCEPVRDLVFRDHFEGHQSKRVFYDQSKKKVYKIYRKQGDSKKPNLSLMQKLGYFKNLELKDFGTSYQLLSYDFLEGTMKPSCKKHIEEAKKILQQIHEYGYVHADVRIGNIVFGPPRLCKAYFIDFDFAGKEGELYHKYYNGDLDERHHDAKPLNAKKFCHDHHSLEKIAALRQRF